MTIVTRRVPARAGLVLALLLGAAVQPAGATLAEAATLTIDSARINASWNEGWLRPGAAVHFTASIDGASALRASLRPVARPGVTAAVDFDVAEAGTFSRAMRLPPRALPGRYRLSLVSTSPPPVPPPAGVVVTIPAPPEGVIDRALVGTTRNGPWRQYVGRTGPAVSGPQRELWVRFRFLHPPRGRRVEIVWTHRWRTVVGRVDRRYARRIDTYARSATPLPKGVWLVVLRIDGRVAKRMSVRLQ